MDDRGKGVEDWMHVAEFLRLDSDREFSIGPEADALAVFTKKENDGSRAFPRKKY